MKDFTKKDLLLIINTYQNYMNDFVNVTDKDINNIYLEVAKQDLHATFYGKLDDKIQQTLAEEVDLGILDLSDGQIERLANKIINKI
jgi:hypothetical protein